MLIKVKKVFTNKILYGIIMSKKVVRLNGRCV